MAIVEYHLLKTWWKFGAKHFILGDTNCIFVPPSFTAMLIQWAFWQTTVKFNFMQKTATGDVKCACNRKMTTPNDHWSSDGFVGYTTTTEMMIFCTPAIHAHIWKWGLMIQSQWCNCSTIVQFGRQSPVTNRQQCCCITILAIDTWKWHLPLCDLQTRQRSSVHSGMENLLDSLCEWLGEYHNICSTFQWSSMRILRVSVHFQKITVSSH